MAQITLRDYLQETEDAISTGRIEDALGNCQYILAYFPEALEAQRLLGDIYLVQGRLEDAQHAFDWVLTNDPENVIAYCNRALVSVRLADYDTALDCYQQAYELSRGNSQIRQQFNQLSQKTGQPGFMLSRAGLARLYMRGDLFSQAIQEWEIVLAATPERLDARTGLLETYWRDGLYEQVMQVGMQILQDVPGCLKALLLLAYVTVSKDMQQAQSLVKRAEAVDPDLLMANDLFADMLASHPGDPFLSLLPKAPVSLGIPHVGARVAAVSGPISEDATSAANWGSEASWGTDTTLIKPGTADKLEPNAPAELTAWGTEDSGKANGAGQSSVSPVELSGLVTPWSSDSQGMQPFGQEASQLEPWQLLQDALHDIAPEVVQNQSRAEKSVWDDLSAVDQHDRGDYEFGAKREEIEDPWGVSLQESNLSAPPAWLSTLTQAERKELTGSIAENPSSQQNSAPVFDEPKKNNQVVEQKQVPAAVVEQKTAQEVVQPVAAVPFATNTPVEPVKEIKAVTMSAVKKDDDDAFFVEEDESFFGPQWLKSLGAASLEGEEPVEVEVSVAEVKPPAVESEKSRMPASSQSAEPASWMSQLGQPEQSVEPASWMSQLGQPEEQLEEPAAQESWMSQLSEIEQPVYKSWDPQGASGQSQPAYASWLSQLGDVQQPAAQGSWMPQLTEPDMQPAYEPWLSQSAEIDTPPAYESWMPRDQEQQSELTEAEKAEQNLVTTLEELEKNLRSKGFISLEPNSLSVIAQGQEGVAGGEPEQEEKQPIQAEQERYQEPSLSSALAELGHFVEQSAANSMPAVASSQPVPVVSEIVSASGEPAWLTELRAGAVETETPRSAPVRQEERVVSNATVIPPSVPKPKGNILPDTPVSPAARSEVGAIVFEPTSFTPSSASEVHEAVRVPAARVNPLLDSELETTMKRPAVRLQPMHQQRPVVQREPVVPASKGRSADRAASKAIDDNMNSRERLLKGYQSQLVGDYDEAMVEYRIIIRNAPELLSEVVSNVRALLKLAPKYSAGYRVLGDAYMRQGEYLQAMESYNKALTMAKKTKS